MPHEHDIYDGRITADMSFHQKVWAATARIPPGRVATYADVAAAVGGPDFRGYRAVGRALGRNPYAPRVPCHRVVGSDGRLTGFAGGLDEKVRLLESEGVAVTRGRVDLGKFRD